MVQWARPLSQPGGLANRRGDVILRCPDGLGQRSALGELRGMFVAQSIKPQARTLAESRGIACVEVDYDELRGNRADDWTLFS